MTEQKPPRKILIKKPQLKKFTQSRAQHLLTLQAAAISPIWLDKKLVAATTKELMVQVVCNGSSFHPKYNSQPWLL